MSPWHERGPWWAPSSSIESPCGPDSPPAAASSPGEELGMEEVEEFEGSMFAKLSHVRVFVVSEFDDEPKIEMLG